MAYNIQINVEKTGLFITSNEKWRTKYLDKINEMIVKSGLFLLSELQKNTPVGATGSLRRGWKMDVEYRSVLGGRVAVVNIYNPLVYNEPTNLGRKAAPVSKKGQDAMRMWVQRKLGKSFAEAKSIAFLICRKKALFPTPGQKYIEKTLDSALPKIVEQLKYGLPGAANGEEGE